MKRILIRGLVFSAIAALMVLSDTGTSHSVCAATTTGAAATPTARSSPRLNLITPRGVQRGGEFTLKFTGERLDTAEEIFVYDAGITVLGIEPIDAKNISVKVKVDDNCRLGEHVAQVRTRDGISDFRSVFVGALPEVAETEPNSSLEEAQKIELGVTVSGVVTNEDIDYFRIEGKKGQRLSVEIEAIRLGYMFDPAIALLDKNRFEVAVSDDTALTKQDSFFSVLLPEDGEYFITVRESSFKGNGNCRYRLHVGSFPRPVAVYPAGGKPGEKVTLQFIDSVRGEDNEVKTSSKEITLSTEEGFRGGLFYEDEHGISPSPLPFRLIDMPNVMEVEPNDTWVETPAIQLPHAINGVIESEMDRDFFKFHSKKDQVWHVSCYARRLGSGLDAVVNIFDANKKSLVGNDDSAKTDSYVRFQAPADGDYFLRVRDHLDRGQPDFIYRVEIAAAKPELAIGIKRVDRYSQQRQTIAVPQGSRFSVLVDATRKDFGGELELLKEGLPAGITMIAPPMKANLNLMPVVFEATANAAIGGQLVDFRARHVETEKNIVGSFVNASDFVLGQPNNAVYYLCSVDKLAMAVIDPLPFKLELVQPNVPMVKNGSIKIKVVAHRDEGFTAPINIQFPFRSPGVGTTYQLTIPEGKSEIEYPLNANGNSQVGKFPMVVIGTSNVKGPAWTSTQMGEIEIAEPFVKMEFERASCEIGQPTKLYCKIEQLTPFDGEATAEILGAPPNINITSPLKFTKDSTELTFEVATTDKSPIGKHGGLFCQVTIVKDGEPIVSRAANAVLQINKIPPPKKTEPAAKAVAAKPAT